MPSPRNPGRLSTIESESTKEMVSDIFPEEDCWYECILTQFRRDRNGIRSEECGCWDSRDVNASAVGVRRRGERLFFRLFRGSDSYEFIEGNRIVGLSVPSLPQGLDLFIRAALHGYKDEEAEFGPEDIKFEGLPTGSVPLLEKCIVGLILNVDEINQVEYEDDLGKTERKEVVASVLAIRGEGAGGQVSCESKQGMKAFTRTTGLIMEALISATRYRVSGDVELLGKAEDYIELAERIGGMETRIRIEKIKEILTEDPE